MRKIKMKKIEIEGFKFVCILAESLFYITSAILLIIACVGIGSSFSLNKDVIIFSFIAMGISLIAGIFCTVLRSIITKIVRTINVFCEVINKQN